jgi:hypothetical protein
MRRALGSSAWSRPSGHAVVIGEPIVTSMRAERGYPTSERLYADGAFILFDYAEHDRESQEPCAWRAGRCAPITRSLW